ncbi:hypothetical protein KP509_27G014600 [Ceratopteris richardii]|uniref:Secreted protein n=1 Tax=Ceratopteris richardii TaxID=49495 RepID=A0A8T2RE66_CERRI|nr:hypothetical protein KP509_27G014600 [Ceratopteris richardii]
MAFPNLWRMLALFTSAFHGAFFPNGVEGILRFCDHASSYITCPPQIAPARVHHVAASVNDGVDEPSNAAANLAPMDQQPTVPQLNEETINVAMEVQCPQLPAQSTEASRVAMTPLILAQKKKQCSHQENVNPQIEIAHECAGHMHLQMNGNVV